MITKEFSKDIENTGNLIDKFNQDQDKQFETIENAMIQNKEFQDRQDEMNQLLEDQNQEMNEELEDDYKELDELEQLEALGELDVTPTQTQKQTQKNVNQEKGVNDYEDALNALLS